MAQSKKPRFDKKSSAFDKRQNIYTAAVHEIFKVCNKEAASLALSTGYDGSKPFSFKNFPATKKKIQQLQSTLALNMKSLVINGTTVEFENSNLVIDKMLQSIFKQYGKTGDIHEFRKHVPQFFEHNNKALAIFQQRTQNGMNLSQRCWILSEEYKSGLEAAVSVGIEKGTSAITLSKQISKYLVDFPKLKKNYTAKFGKANNVVDCEYRAVRLARTEINMAYRTAEQNRWKQLDFVVGYEVKRSATEYDCPVCDALMGKYPTYFKFVGWHPNCYDEKSEVYTKEGWKFFKDVKNDDLILSINPNTFDLEYSNILLNISRQHNGKMVHFFNRSYSQFVTPEHEVLHLSKNALNTFRRTTANECGKTQPIYRSSKWKGMFFPTVTIGCNVISIRLFAEFMGYWLADGSLGHKYEISIAQQETDKQSMILSGIQRMGFNARHHAGKVEFNNKDFFEYLQQFGKCNTKFIPDEIKNSTPEIIQIFLDAFISCDGYIRPQRAFIGSKGSLFIPKNNERVYFTTSKRLADDIGELILKIGKRPSFRTQNTKGKEHQFKNGIYTINFDTIVISECNSITATQYKKECVDYNGMVYDLTLAKNNTMYIRRNGKCFWGSNCRCYTVPILKTPEEMRADTQKILSGKKTNDDSVNKITDVPQNFKDWVMLNEDRINAAKDKGTLPYFLKDNKGIWDKQLSLQDIKNNINSNSDITTEDIFYHDDKYNSKRATLHNEIRNTYIGDSNAKSDTVYMLGGATANGKSTLVNAGILPYPKGSLVIDADKIKSMIPEYKLMLNSENKKLIEAAANFVHEESSFIGKQVQSEAFSKNIAVVIDGINDGSFEKVSKRVSDIKSATAGKRIRADYVSLDTSLSIKLAKIRADKTGRKVPLNFILHKNKDISKLIPLLIKNNTFDELYLWDTNINGKPRLILKMIDGKLTMQDKSLYDDFIKKAN